MFILYIIVVIAVIVSFVANRQKTKKALKIGMKKLWRITPSFISILIGISIVLYLVPHEVIVNYLGSSYSLSGIGIASVIGSITVMPGPIVYPLCRILVDKGVSYSIIAAFSSSLMLVGVLTFPVEKEYFGKKFAVLRNILSFVIALIIALVFAFADGKLI